MTISGAMETRVSVDLGARIHQIMWTKRVSQKEIGKVLGVVQAGVSNRLRGKTPFTIPELVAVANHLEVSAAQLLGEVTGGEVVVAPTDAAAAARWHAAHPEPQTYLDGIIEGSEVPPGNTAR